MLQNSILAVLDLSPLVLWGKKAQVRVTNTSELDEMIKMVMDINENVMAPLKFDPVSCWTCHRGDEYSERGISDTKKKKQHKH